MDGIVSWFQQLEFDFILNTILAVTASLLCITVHESCHGLAALWLGDDTAKRQGRLSLNPLRHVDVLGLLMMSLLRFGWAKPVPINPQRFRNPKMGMMLSALAGPLSNVILAFLAILLRNVLLALVPFESMGTAFHWLRAFLEITASISAGLAVFNLFPVPPLDGSKVLFAILPDRWYMRLMRYERYGMLVLMVLLLTNVLDTPLLFLRDALLNGILTVTEPIFFYIVNHFV